MAVVQLRPGVVFRGNAAGAGSFEFVAGRRVDNVRLEGTVPARTEDGKPAQVNVLSAVYPTSSAQLARREHLPALTVVAVQTQFLRADRAILFSVCYLPFFVDSARELDPAGTIALVMHGSVEVDDDDHMRTGSPCLPGTNPNQWIFLEPSAVATLVGWIRGPAGRRPNALVNIGCFSSTRTQKQSASFNEELAALLAEQEAEQEPEQGDIAVYGPPHAGIVTAATSFGQWKSFFSQRLEDELTIREVPIRFQRIVPAARRALPRQTAHGAPVASGAVVITNDFALASELCSFSPDFSARAHDVDRTLMD